MKVHFDAERCAGHAQCAALAPDVYPLDDEGYCVVGERTEIAEDQQANAVRGAEACPEGALRIIPS